MPEGGSEAERESLLGEYAQWVVKKNDKILAVKNFRHYLYFPAHSDQIYRGVPKFDK